MNNGHSSIGASSAYRWFECPGSVQLSAQAPPSEDTVYAQQGTAAHWLIERFYTAERTNQKIDLWSFEGKLAPNNHEFLPEDIEAVEKFISFMDEYRKDGKFVLHAEAKFDLSGIFPGLYGTSDIVLMESNMKRLRVVDYKHGAGIPVEVENNRQLLYYALGAIQHVCTKHKIDYLSVLGWGSVFKEVEIVVVQPRCRHKDGIVRKWVVNAETLDKFAVELAEKAKATQVKNPPFKTGDHCRFCPALAICPTFNNQTMEIVNADFKAVSHPSNLNLPSPESLSPGEIVKILDFSDLIIEFLKKVEGHALSLLEHGVEVNGYKLVKKKSNRQWRDEEEAKETLSLYLNEEDMYEKKFVSPAKAEKLFNKEQKKEKKIIETLTVQPDNGNTIAPEHDPREAVSGSAVNDFNALT